MHTMHKTYDLNQPPLELSMVIGFGCVLFSSSQKSLIAPDTLSGKKGDSFSLRPQWYWQMIDLMDTIIPTPFFVTNPFLFTSR